MNNNMTGTNTLNAIYENMGCKGTTYNGSLRPLSENTLCTEAKRKCPSNLEVVPYVADKHAHLPDYAREMIEMIEEAEYEALEKKNDKPFTWLSYTSEDKILLIKVINNPDNTSSISETVTLNRLTGDVINE